MKIEKDLLDEWRVIVDQAKGYVERGQEDIADEAIIAIDDYVYWLEAQLEFYKHKHDSEVRA